MSKLSQMIDYTFTGDVAIDRRPKLNYLSATLNTYKDGAALYGTRRHFKLSAKLETSAWLDEDCIIHSVENPTAIQQNVLNDLKRSMVEEVFGEFRPLIIEMRAAIYDKDDTRIRNLLAEFEQRMFVE